MNRGYCLARRRILGFVDSLRNPGIRFHFVAFRGFGAIARCVGELGLPRGSLALHGRVCDSVCSTSLTCGTTLVRNGGHNHGFLLRLRGSLTSNGATCSGRLLAMITVGTGLSISVFFRSGRSPFMGDDCRTSRRVTRRVGVGAGPSLIVFSGLGCRCNLLLRSGVATRMLRRMVGSYSMTYSRGGTGLGGTGVAAVKGGCRHVAH